MTGRLVGGLPTGLGVDLMNPQSLRSTLILWSRLDRHTRLPMKQNRDLTGHFVLDFLTYLLPASKHNIESAVCYEVHFTLFLFQKSSRIYSLHLGGNILLPCRNFFTDLFLFFGSFTPVYKDS